MALRILVADDSSVFRRAITDALASLPDAQVVGSAPNGKIALQKVLDLKPDLLTLDMEMPEMDGLAVLDALKQAGSTTSVMVISAVTLRGGRLTMQALEKGAFDFLTKPQGKDAAESKAMMMRELAPMACPRQRRLHPSFHPRPRQARRDARASPGGTPRVRKSC
jgi:two-component system chemotaxis response regulator CheB